MVVVVVVMRAGNDYTAARAAQRLHDKESEIGFVGLSRRALGAIPSWPLAASAGQALDNHQNLAQSTDRPINFIESLLLFPLSGSMFFLTVVPQTPRSATGC